MKRFIAFILCIIMTLALVPTSAFAASSTLVREQELAEDLKALGLFRGVSETDFALNRAPTRVEALVMLIRVLGKESDALAKGGRHPFLDVPQWADKYVGYAYENKLTNGVSATKFGSNSDASASMYITFVLRALGYSDANGDFTWDNPYTLARETGVMRGNPDAIKFLRADVVLVSYAALEAEVKGTGKTLADKLIEAGVFTKAKYESCYNVSEFENEDNKKADYNSEEIYKNCYPAVFFIEVYNRNGKRLGSGSGFFIDSDGTAVTNYHVIEGAASAKIRRSDNEKIYKVEGVYDYSEKEDWAVIKIEGENFPYLEIEKTEEVRGGQTVYAIGSPLGLENTISEGLISNANRTIDGEKYIQISVPISPGSSGGALINRSGHVVGITSEVFEVGQNLNLARPISVIDGFTKKKAYPLTSIGSYEEDEMTVGAVNTDGMSKGEKTKTLLRAWIINNANLDVDGTPCYYEEHSSGGDTAFLGAIYSEELEKFLILSDYYFKDGGKCTSYIAFSEKSDMVDLNYKFYEYDDTPYAKIDKSLAQHKLFFHDLMCIYFESEYRDPDDISMHNENANALWYAAASMVDKIISKELAAYGLTGIEDIGFTEFHVYD